MTFILRFALTLSVLVSLSTGAAAHSKMDETTPANGSVIAAMPAMVSLHFGKKIRLTKVTLTHEADTPVAFDLSAFGSFANKFDLPVADQGAGSYIVDWRGLGADGHALKGSFRFEVTK